MERISDKKKPSATRLNIPIVFKRLLIAIWLGFLYVLCVSMVMSSLSGSLFQEKLHKIAKPNKESSSPFSIHHCKPEKFKEELLTENSLIEALCLPTDSNAALTYYDLNEIIIGYNMWNRASQSTILRHSKVSESEKKEIINNLKKNITELENKISKTEKKVDEINLKFDKSELQTLEATLDFVTTYSYDKNILSQFEEISHFNSFFASVKTILKKVSFGTFADYFWSYPRPILKLILILSMGILGSLIFVTIEFIREPKTSLSNSFVMYFFRPFLGMIMALAVYVMVKSGQSTVFNTFDSDLSPYVISFLGIISGMLADQAYRNMSFAGGKILNAGRGDENTGTDKKEEGK